MAMTLPLTGGALAILPVTGVIAVVLVARWRERQAEKEFHETKSQAHRWMSGS